MSRRTQLSKAMVRRPMIVLLCAVSVPTLTLSTDVPLATPSPTTALTPAPTQDIMRDTSMDGRICAAQARVFYLHGEDVKEDYCTEMCHETADCVAYSGNWIEEWCIGCNEALGEVRTGTMAFKKWGYDDDGGGYYGSPPWLDKESNDDFCHRQIYDFPDACNSDSFQQLCEQVCGDFRVTSTTDPVLAGSITVAVADITGINVGNAFTVAHGGPSETKIVTSVTITSAGRRLTTAGIVTVDSPFEHDYPAGANVTVSQAPTAAPSPPTSAPTPRPTSETTAPTPAPTERPTAETTTPTPAPTNASANSSDASANTSNPTPVPTGTTPAPTLAPTHLLTELPTPLSTEAETEHLTPEPTVQEPEPEPEPEPNSTTLTTTAGLPTPRPTTMDEEDSINLEFNLVMQTEIPIIELRRDEPFMAGMKHVGLKILGLPNDKLEWISVLLKEARRLSLRSDRRLGTSVDVQYTAQIPQDFVENVTIVSAPGEIQSFVEAAVENAESESGKSYGVSVDSSALDALIVKAHENLEDAKREKDTTSLASTSKATISTTKLKTPPIDITTTLLQRGNDQWAAVSQAIHVGANSKHLTSLVLLAQLVIALFTKRVAS